MRRFVIVAELREGSARRVAEVLREGPPYALEQTSLERHEVFLSEREVVFLFEGVHAEEEAKRLLGEDRLLESAGRLGVHLRSRPRVPAELFGWERASEPEGVAFGAQPGPGQSEGGGAE